MIEKTSRIINEVKKVIVGKDEIIEKILLVILAPGHILLEDLPGMGKTTLALAFSRSMSLDYRRLQFTPDTMASDVIGFSVYNKQTSSLEYKPGAVFCNMLLVDEINRTSPKTQAALLEAMEEQSVTVDGVTHALPHPFICIATQNPIGSAGTQNLPESQLDRFMVRLTIGYPSRQDQIDIIKNRQQLDPLEMVEAVVTVADILKMREQVQSTYVADEIIGYVADLGESTRDCGSIECGISPRAVMAAVQMAKAHAFIGGRDYVIPEDVRAVFGDVSCHRIILTPKARIKKEDPHAILNQLMESVKAPAIIA